MGDGCDMIDLEDLLAPAGDQEEKSQRSRKTPGDGHDRGADRSLEREAAHRKRRQRSTDWPETQSREGPAN